MTTEIIPIENPYPKPEKHPTDLPELEESDLHKAWNEGYVAGTLDVVKVVAKFLRGEFAIDYDN